MMSGSKTPAKSVRTPIKGRRSDPTANTAPYPARNHRGYYSLGEVPAHTPTYPLGTDYGHQTHLDAGSSNPYPNLPAPPYLPKTYLQKQSIGEGSSTSGAATYQEGYGQFQQRQAVNQNLFQAEYYHHQPIPSACQERYELMQRQSAANQNPYEAYRRQQQRQLAANQNPYEAYRRQQQNKSVSHWQHPEIRGPARLNPTGSGGVVSHSGTSAEYQTGCHQENDPSVQRQLHHRMEEHYGRAQQSHPAESEVAFWTRVIPQLEEEADVAGQIVKKYDATGRDDITTGSEDPSVQRQLHHRMEEHYGRAQQSHPEESEVAFWTRVIPQLEEEEADFAGQTVEKYDATRRDDITTGSEGIISKRLYVFGGYSAPLNRGGMTLQTVIYYDFNASLWKDAKDMLLSRSGFAAAVFEGTIWIAGGYGISLEDPRSGRCVIPAVTMYDPVNDAWTKETAMNTRRDKLGLAKYDGRLFAVGGQDEKGKYLCSVEIYDPKSRDDPKMWVKGKDMERPRADMGIAATTNFLIVVGGETVTKECITEFFDSQTDQWTIAKNIKTKSFPKCVAAVLGDSVYLLRIDEIGIYVCPNGGREWKRCRPIPYEPTKYAGFASSDGKLYVVGGVYDRVGQDKVSCYHPNTERITGIAPMPGVRVEARAVAINKSPP